MADMVLALMPPIKQSKKLSNLKYWVGAPMISGLLGKEAVQTVLAVMLML